jgi:hypothetical protein
MNFSEIDACFNINAPGSKNWMQWINTCYSREVQEQKNDREARESKSISTIDFPPSLSFTLGLV